MKAPLHILHAEDNDIDAEMMVSRLRAGGIQALTTIVKNRQDFEQALAGKKLDLIISDFSMPGFGGILALRIARQKRPEVPFIFLSGTIGEEVAIESLKEGAADYVLKDRPSRLVPAVEQALRQAREMSERRKMEERIHEQAALLDKAQDAICVKDMSQHILYWNKGAERLYGWASREAVGRNADELLFSDDPGVSAEALRALIRRSEWQGELRQVTRDQRAIIVESRWTLLRDAAGAPKSILVINSDITEKKQLEAQFLRNQRVESVGALAGGIAHDLNNALTPIMIGVAVLRDEKLSPDGRQMLDLMVTSARHSVNMVKQILSFSRGVGGEQIAMSVQELVMEMVELAHKTFPRVIKVQAKIAENIHPVTGNRTQLHQVLLNLCLNARDAMPQGGDLTIKVENVELGTARLPAGLGLSPGPFVQLKVSDTGQGIALEMQKRIFEPFFTTKEPGKGTGLGLSTVIGIVKTHGGFLDIASEVGRGTTFKIYLPAKVPLG